MANFQYFSYYYVFTSMKLVLYLSLVLWKSEALGYMKFNLSLSTAEFDRPYLTQIFLGTPPQLMDFYIDMGSDLVRVSCGIKQGETMPPAETLNDTMPPGDYITTAAGLVYNVNESSTFSHVFCNLPGFCPPRFQANRPDDCSNETYCTLPSDKPDRSNTMYLSMDKLNMNDDFSDFMFACDPYDIQEFTSSSRGVLGLGRMQPSFFEDFGHMYDNCLSYCLPLEWFSAGYLAFGLQNGKSCSGGDDDHHTSSSLVLTDLSVHPNNPSSYLINIASITVNTTQISINSSDESGILVNPATFFTTLPSEVYKAMRDIFMETNNNTVLNDYTYDNGGLDLCFNTSIHGAAGLKIPKVLMTFANNATVELDQLGIIYVVNEDISCLGFKGNGDPDSPSVFGGMQQAKLEVGIDVANNKIGFRPKTTCW